MTIALKSEKKPVLDSREITRFEYRYRDAGGFKAYGSIIVGGTLSLEQRLSIADKMEDSQFVAEQIGIPALYSRLYEFSDGAIQSDICWHEFVGFDERTSIGADEQIWGTAKQLTDRFQSVNNWDLSLSPHAVLEL